MLAREPGSEAVSSSTGPAKRVLVVGINYAPEHTGIAPYTTQACEYLLAQGAEVLVLSGIPHYPHWSAPPRYRHRLRVDESLEGVQVRRLRHFVPRRQSAITRGLYEATYGARVRTQSLPWSPDVVLAVVPSLIGALAALALAKRNRARFVVWVQDLMGNAAAESGIAGGAAVASTTRWLEEKVLTGADDVIVLSEAFKRHVESIGVPGKQIHVVRNWARAMPTARDRREVRQLLDWKDDQIIALHSGNMGLKQGLENIVEAARLAAHEAPLVRFVLMGDGNQSASLKKRGAHLKNLIFLPPVANDEFPDVLAAADVLLVNERSSAVEMSLPSKLTSYFQTGLPVIAAVPGLGGTAHEVHSSGAGRVITPGDAAALLTGVLDLAHDHELRDIFRTSAAAHVERHLSAAAGLSQLAEIIVHS